MPLTWWDFANHLGRGMSLGHRTPLFEKDEPCKFAVDVDELDNHCQDTSVQETIKSGAHSVT